MVIFRIIKFLEKILLLLMKGEISYYFFIKEKKLYWIKKGGDFFIISILYFNIYNVCYMIIIDN